MFDFSPVQIIIVLVIALLVFGPKRLPEMGRNLGRSMREFKNSVSGDAAPEPAPGPARAGTPAEGRTSSAPTPEIAAAEGVPAVPGSGTTAAPAPTPEIAQATLVGADADDRRVGAPR